MRSQDDHKHLSRRHFLGVMGKAALICALPVPVMASNSPAHHQLGFLNTHTGEKLVCNYREGGKLLPDAVAAINHILRDHRTGEVAAIDTGLLDFMHNLARRLGTDEPFHIISGYRSPKTNEALRQQGRGVARKSYHMVGKAVDLRLPGVSTRDLRDAASGERSGGVGYYPGPGFVHIDTGPVRHW